MLNIFSKRPITVNAHHFLILDFNSDNVKCVVIENDNILGKSKNNILYSLTEKLEYGVIRNGLIIDLESLVQKFLTVINNITDVMDKHINDIIVCVSGEACFDLVTTAKVTRSSALAITHAEMDEMYSRIIDASYNELQKDLLNITAIPNSDLEIIVNDLVYTKLDDVMQNAVVDHRAHTIEMAVYSSYIAKQQLILLNALVRKLNKNLVAVAPVLHSFARSLKFTQPEFFDAVVINISSDFTDVGVVFGGSVINKRNLPIGRAHFVRELSTRTNLPYPDADNKLQAYCAEKLTENESIHIHECLRDISFLWLDSLGLTFTEFIGVKTFAPQIYICGEGADIPDILYYLRKEPWYKVIPFRGVPDVHKMTVAQIPYALDSMSVVTGSTYLPCIAASASIFDH